MRQNSPVFCPDDPQVAFPWNIEAPCLATSAQQMVSSVSPAAQFGQCLGSSKCWICSERRLTEIGRSSCVVTLFFEASVDAPSVGETSLGFLEFHWTSNKLRFCNFAHDISLRWFHCSGNSCYIIFIQIAIIFWFSHLHHHTRLLYADYERKHEGTVWFSKMLLKSCYQIKFFLRLIHSQHLSCKLPLWANYHSLIRKQKQEWSFWKKLGENCYSALASMQSGN